MRLIYLQGYGHDFCKFIHRLFKLSLGFKLFSEFERLLIFAQSLKLSLESDKKML